MSIRMAIAVAAGLGAAFTLATTAGAQIAAPKSAPPKIQRLAGCAFKGTPEWCVMMKGPKNQLYNLTGANPAVPTGRPVSLRGTVTTKIGPCGGIVLDDIKWGNFPGKCPKPAPAK